MSLNLFQDHKVLYHKVWSIPANAYVAHSENKPLALVNII